MHRAGVRIPCLESWFTKLPAWVQGDECSCDLCTVDEYIYDLFKTRNLPLCVVLVFNISFYLALTV